MKEFSKNPVEIFGKVLFHYLPDIMKYIDEIKEERVRKLYSMRYVFVSEMRKFLICTIPWV